MKKLIFLLLFLALISPCFGDIYTSHQKPTTDSTLDLGTSSLLWRSIYGDSFTDNTASWSGSSLSDFISISGTTLTDGTFSVSGGIISAGTWQGSTIVVSYGGTGATTLTDGGILLGSGTSAVTALAVASNGQIPIGDGATDPVLATITGSAGITVTNGAGSITLDVNDTGVDHGGLTGLGDSADHLWAVLIDGTRDLTGDWTISTNDITLSGGHIQAENFKTDEVTNNTVFVGDDSGGSGTACTNIGEHSGENNTANGQVATGNYSGQNNSGVNQNTYGFSTGQDNSGTYQSAFGHAAGQRNAGNNQVVIGGFTGQNNLGSNQTALGYLAGQHNTEDNQAVIGNSTGQWNTGENMTGGGNFAGRWNDSDNATVFGFNAFNLWTDDTPSAETFDNTDIDDVNDRIAITSHGFGATNSYTNLMYDVGTSSIPGLTDGTIYQWKVINANLIELRIGDITDAGSGTGHTFTPKVCYANSSAFGHDAEPDAAAQIMLGDLNVTQVKSAGGIYLADGAFIVGATGTLNSYGGTTTQASADSDSTIIQTADGFDMDIGDGLPGGDTGDYTNVSGEGGDGAGGFSGGDSGDWLGGSSDAGTGISAGSSTSGNATLKTGTAHFSGFGSATTGYILLQTGDTIAGTGVAGDITFDAGTGSDIANSGSIIYKIRNAEVARFTPLGALHIKDDKEFILGDGADFTLSFSSGGDRISAFFPTKVMQFGNPSTAYMQITPNGDISQAGAGRTLESEKYKLTAIGGYAIKLTNETGANTIAGQLVKADTATNDAVVLTAASDTECFGVFLDSGDPNGSETWVVVGGIADVAMGDNEAATRGNWVEVHDSEAGYADATGGSPAAAPEHFEEIGHCIESVAAGGAPGTHILARCVLHFL